MQKVRWLDQDCNKCGRQLTAGMLGYQRLWHINIPAVNPVSPGNMICQRRGCGTVWKTISGCAPARDCREELR